MMDQCKTCIVKGDLNACEETVCDIHENWYTKKLSMELSVAKDTRLRQRIKINSLKNTIDLVIEEAKVLMLAKEQDSFDEIIKVILEEEV